MSLCTHKSQITSAFCLISMDQHKILTIEILKKCEYIFFWHFLARERKPKTNFCVAIRSCENLPKSPSQKFKITCGEREFFIRHVKNNMWLCDKRWEASPIICRNRTKNWCRFEVLSPRFLLLIFVEERFDWLYQNSEPEMCLVISHFFRGLSANMLSFQTTRNSDV